MENNKQVIVRSGMGPATLLTIIFIVLKVIGQITWSWWWVFSPIWISIGLGLAFFAIGITIILLAAGITHVFGSSRKRRWQR